VHEISHNRQGRDTGVSPPAAATTATPWLRYCFLLDAESCGLRRRVMADFYKIAGFPNVLRCVNGTQIPILSPAVNEKIQATFAA